MSDVIKQKRATYHLYTFLVSKMISSLGANVYTFGISMFILAITGSALSFAANLFLSIIPRVILSPIAGIITDRFPRKAVVLVGQGGSILSIIALLSYSLVFDLSIIAIYITTFFYTISNTFSSIAFSASVSNLVDAERIQKAMSFNQISLSISGICGPIIGGMMFGFASIELFLLLNILSYLVAFLLESTLNFKLYSYATNDNNNKIENSLLQSLKEGLVYIKTKPIIYRLLMVVVWLNLFFTAVTVGTNFMLVKVFNMPFSLIGFIEAFEAIGMLLVSIYLATRSNIKYPLQFSRLSVLGLSVLVGTIAIPLLFHFSGPLLFSYFLLTMFLFGCLSVLTNTPIGIIMQKDVDEAFRGRVFGILEMMALGLMPIGSLIFGVLYDTVPAAMILIICSIFLVILTLVLLPSSFIRSIYPELKKEKTDSKPASEKVNDMLMKRQIRNEYQEHIVKQKQLCNPTTIRM